MKGHGYEGKGKEKKAVNCHGSGIDFQSLKDWATGKGKKGGGEPAQPVGS